MMDWVKVTPETMPKPFEEVMATIETDGARGKRREFRPVVRWLGDERGWEEYEAIEDCVWWPICAGERVTHWMKYPAVAED